MATTDIILPQVNARGIFVLYAPYANYLDPNTIYECKEIRKFDELIKKKINIRKEYYNSSISEADYKTHLANGASIVTLRSDAGQLRYVPSPYIKSFPLGIGVPYRNIVLGIRLGALKDDVDLTVLKTKIQDLVKNTMGIDSECITAVTSETTILSYADSDSLELARKTATTDPTSNTSKLVKQEAEILALRNTITLLEKYIVDNKI